MRFKDQCSFELILHRLSAIKVSVDFCILIKWEFHSDFFSLPQKTGFVAHMKHIKL